MSPPTAPTTIPAQDDERRFDIASFLLWLGALALVTVAMLTVRMSLEKVHVALGYLLVVRGAAASTGRRIGVALSLVAFLCFNFFFLPPYHSLIIAQPLDWIVLVAFLVTGIVAAQLLARARADAALARQRTAEVDRLSAGGAEALNAGRAEDALAAIAEGMRAPLHVARRVARLDRCKAPARHTRHIGAPRHRIQPLAAAVRQQFDHARGHAACACSRPHHQRSELVAAVGVGPQLRRTDQRDAVAGHDETRPVQIVRVEPLGAHQRHDGSLVGGDGVAHRDAGADRIVSVALHRTTSTWRDAMAAPHNNNAADSASAADNEPVASARKPAGTGPMHWPAANTTE